VSVHPGREALAPSPADPPPDGGEGLPVVASSIEEPGSPASTAGEPGVPEGPDEDASSPTEPPGAAPRPPSSQTDQPPEDGPHAPTAIEMHAAPRRDDSAVT